MAAFCASTKLGGLVAYCAATEDQVLDVCTVVLRLEALGAL